MFDRSTASSAAKCNFKSSPPVDFQGLNPYAPIFFKFMDFLAPRLGLFGKLYLAVQDPSGVDIAMKDFIK